MDEVPERIGDLHDRLRRERLPSRLHFFGKGEDLEAVDRPRRDEKGVRLETALAKGIERLLGTAGGYRQVIG